jgi:hypothetical protein
MKNLSLSQEDYLPALMWLIDPNHNSRMSGRTHTLAYAFIKTAILNPGKDICVFDHQTHPTAFNQLVREIRLLLGSDEFKNYPITYKANVKCLICER